MTFNRVKPIGWGFGETLTSTQMNQLDEDHSNAIDGLNGGSYSLTQNLELNGASGKTITLTLPLITTNDVTIGNNAGDDLTVNAIAAFASPVLFSGAATASAPFQFDGAVVINSSFRSHVGTFIVGDTSADAFVVNSFANFKSSVICDQGAVFGTGGIDVQDTSLFRKPISFNGTGKIKWRTKTISVAGNQSIVAANFDRVLIPSGLMSNSDVISLDDTGAEDGMEIIFQSNDATNHPSILTPASLSVSLQSNTTNSTAWVAFTRFAGVWQPRIGIK